MTPAALEEVLGSWDPTAHEGMSRCALPFPFCVLSSSIPFAVLEFSTCVWRSLSRGAKLTPSRTQTVPVCQNPTGATMPAERKKAIYDICVKYDVIIVEDDRSSFLLFFELVLTRPLAAYYFLQAGEYESPDSRSCNPAETDDEFLASLVPSYLKFDYQGRVIRIDTFSSALLLSRLGPR